MFSIDRLTLITILLMTLASAVPAGGLGDLATIEVEEGVVDLRTSAGALVRLTFLSENLFRIQAAAGDTLQDEGSGAARIVLESSWPGVSLEMVKRDDHHWVGTKDLELIVHARPLWLELRRRADGFTLWRELRPLRLSDEVTVQTLSSDEGEHFFGGGQQNGNFEFKGRQMEISYSGGWEEGDQPSPAPFYLSDRGYGILRNTWSDGVYDFRSDGYLTATHAENRFDAYVMVGESIHEVLDLYTRLTGRAGLLPRWAFGYGDADCYNDGDNVKKPGTVPDDWSDGPTGATSDVVASVAAKYREHDMPGSWILPNDGYGCGYEDLPGVVKRLHDLGFRTGLWTEDGVEKIAWEVGTAGSRVQKLDVAWTGKGHQWAMDANHDAAKGILENSDSRPFLWTVMGWAGIQRYAVTWTGDQSGGWDFIRWHVPTLIGSGLSGMNYSTGDVDGIFGGSPETFTRDLQWKCFTPVLMGMSGWSRTERKHPWWFDEPYRSINRRYLKLRQRLMPYIYTLARETETTGAPMVRGVMWDHPDDPLVGDHPYQFFLGRDLLVAPVYRSQAASGGWRKGVYLPEGRWVDYWDGAVIEAGAGGTVVDVPVDLATIPVMVRGGAIIPMVPESLFDGEKPPDPLTLDIYPYGESAFELYEDDGNTREYLEGGYSLQEFSVTAAADGERIEVLLHPAEGSYAGMLEVRGHVLQLHVSTAPDTVKVDGKPLSVRSEEDSPELPSGGWTFDVDDRGGLLVVDTGRIAVRDRHRIVVEFSENAIPPAGDDNQQGPIPDSFVAADQLLVVARPAEEPGHPLENAFDGDPTTWFRTVRDQSVAYGPHEFVLSLGGRRVIEGFTIRPRNDKHWRYGQVRGYEVYLADVNGEWGDPIDSGMLEQLETQQQVRFAPRAGRLLRFRILSTHDDGGDPMVVAVGGQGLGAVDALAPVRVSPATISEFRLTERKPSGRSQLAVSFADGTRDLMMDGLPFGTGRSVTGSGIFDLELNGDWQSLAAEVGIDDRSTMVGEVRFQVWGDGRLLWDSGEVVQGQIIKPRIDIRGLNRLSLKTVASHSAIIANWADLELVGFEGDTVQPVDVAPETP